MVKIYKRAQALILGIAIVVVVLLGVVAVVYLMNQDATPTPTVRVPPTTQPPVVVTPPIVEEQPEEEIPEEEPEEPQDEEPIVTLTILDKIKQYASNRNLNAFSSADCQFDLDQEAEDYFDNLETDIEDDFDNDVDDVKEDIDDNIIDELDNIQDDIRAVRWSAVNFTDVGGQYGNESEILASVQLLSDQLREIKRTLDSAVDNTEDPDDYSDAVART